MKLKELIKNEIIKGDELSVMIDLLKECEELQNCDELIIVKEPVLLDELVLDGLDGNALGLGHKQPREDAHEQQPACHPGWAGQSNDPTMKNHALIKALNSHAVERMPCQPPKPLARG
jgi:hypothetical protein